MLEKGYGILPNAVLYSKELTDKQKLLFVVVSSLCAEKGYCWATNEFIGELLGVNLTTISTNMGKLQQAGYIEIEIFTKEGNKRHIRLAEGGLLKNQKRSFEKSKEGSFEKSKEGSFEKSKDINTSTNNTISEHYKQTALVGKSEEKDSISELKKADIDEEVQKLLEAKATKLTAAQKAKILLWFGKGLSGAKVIKTDLRIERIKKQLEVTDFETLVEAMRRNEHNKRAAGKDTKNKYRNNTPRRWSLEYIFVDNYKTKSSIETSLKREVDIMPSEKSLSLLASIQFLLPQSNVNEYGPKDTSYTGRVEATVDRKAQLERAKSYKQGLSQNSI